MTIFAVFTSKVATSFTSLKIHSAKIIYLNKPVNHMQNGDQLPEFRLQNQDAKWIESTSLIGQPLVIYFYPKDDTPGCTAEACSFRDSFEDFRELGAHVVGISADSPSKHAAFAKKYRLPFTLLSDDGNKVRKAFNVPKSFLGLLPGRVTYIFDQEGKLVHQFNSQLKVKQHITEALNIVKRLSIK